MRKPVVVMVSHKPWRVFRLSVLENLTGIRGPSRFEFYSEQQPRLKKLKIRISQSHCVENDKRFWYYAGYLPDYPLLKRTPKTLGN